MSITDAQIPEIISEIIVQKDNMKLGEAECYFCKALKRLVFPPLK